MKNEKNNIDPKFSFFMGPITNLQPWKLVTIADIYRGVTSDYYKTRVEKLRAATDPDERAKIKRLLDYVTFAGVFTKREKAALIKPSGLCCIDFDHLDLDHLMTVKNLLLKDPMFETQLLFKSPSGTGFKFVIEVDLITYPDYELNFRGAVGYLKLTYPKYFNVETNYIDETGKDICRACFMSWDPDAFINPKYFNHAK